MMTALPLMLPAVAPLPVLAVAPVASFDAVLADVVQQPVIADIVAPTEAGVDQAPIEAAFDEEASELKPIPGPEAVTAAPAPELMVAAQIMAVAAQIASSAARPVAARELPQQNGISFSSRKTEAPVRTLSVNAGPALAKPQNDPESAETTAPDIEPVLQNNSSQPSNHRLPVEPMTFNLPAIAAPASIQPQIFHELDLARDLAWIGNLAQDIVASSDDRDHLSFRLMPRSLGQLDVDLSRSPDGLHVEMTATTERATQIIAAEQPRLIEELRQSGIKTTGTDLQTGQHPGSQRGHLPPRADLPFFNTPTRSEKPTNRPDGRFA